MSQQPTPTGNPCLHASFQKENRTLAMGPVRRRSVPKYPCAAVLRPIWPPSPRRPKPVEPAIRLHSCVEQLAAHTTVHYAPRQAAVSHHFACPEHYCTIIVSTSETTHRTSTVQGPQATLVPYSRSNETSAVRLADVRPIAEFTSLHADLLVCTGRLDT